MGAGVADGVVVVARAVADRAGVAGGVGTQEVQPPRFTLARLDGSRLQQTAANGSRRGYELPGAPAPSVRTSPEEGENPRTPPTKKQKPSTGPLGENYLAGLGPLTPTFPA